MVVVEKTSADGAGVAIPICEMWWIGGEGIILWSVKTAVTGARDCDICAVVVGGD